MASMSRQLRLALLAGCATAVLGTTYAAHAADAQSNQAQGRPQAAAAGLEEVVVSARRVEENVQTVPISVVPISEEKLQSRDLIDVQGLVRLTPGLNTSGNANFVWLRGLLGVASYFADAPYTREGNGQYFDIGNMAVLKGPQGTLFGSSSASGAIVINPKRPTEVFEGYVSATFGDYGRRTLEGAINAPLVEDKLLFRLAGQSWYRKGFLYSPQSGKHYANEDYFTIRPSLTFRPTENLENYTVIQYYYSKNNGNPSHVGGYNPNGTWANVIVGRPQADFLFNNFLTDPFTFNGLTVSQGFSGIKRRVFNIVNHTRWDINDNTSLTNIATYRRYGEKNSVDNIPVSTGISNDPRTIALRSGPMYINTFWSEELKLQGKLFDDIVDYTLGTFHMGDPTVFQYALSNNAIGALQASITKGQNPLVGPGRARAFYGQADFDLSEFLLEGLTFTTGYRYTWNTLFAYRNDLRVAPTVPYTQFLTNVERKLKAKFSDDNWLFGLRWQYTPETMFFVTASKGVTTGQLNLAAPAGKQISQPEKLRQIEGGVKSTYTLGDMQIRTNVSAFYGWFTDVQVAIAQLVQVVPPPAPRQLVVVQENAAKAKLKGVDVDLAVVPTDWLELTFTGAFNRNKYTYWPIVDPATGAVIGDRSNTYFIANPRNAFGVSGTIHIPVEESWGAVSVTANYTRESLVHYNAGQPIGQFLEHDTRTVANGYGPLAADGKIYCTECDPPLDLLDISVRWDEPMGVSGLSADFAVNNVTDTLRSAYGSYLWHNLGVKVPKIGAPRMWTVNLKYAF